MNCVTNNSVAVNGFSLNSLSFSWCGGCHETLDNCICYIDGDEQIEDDIKQVKGQIIELKMKKIMDFPIKGYGIHWTKSKKWAKMNTNDAHKEAKKEALEKERNKLNRLMESNKQYKIEQRDYNKNNCDCCGELWTVCVCHCSRCYNYYRLCKNECYVEKKEEEDDDDDDILYDNTI
jgi:hypothetical protein